MWPFLYRWIYRDVWCVTYPNWIAGGAVALLGYAWGKKEILKLHTKLDRHHAELKAHITKVHGGK